MEIALVSTTARRRFTLISPDMVKDRAEHNISARGSGQKLSSQHLDSRTVGRGIMISHKRILMKKLRLSSLTNSEQRHVPPPQQEVNMVKEVEGAPRVSWGLARGVVGLGL